MKLRNKKTGEVVDLKEDYIRVIESFIDYVEKADESFECDESVHKFTEKLKAWRRLKEKGFKFEWWISEYSGNHIEFYIDSMEWDNQVNEDLDLLFEGKNETH